MKMIKSPGTGGWSSYLDHIGLFFFFVACAGISIIVWIFNWICWLNQCCCCDFLHNPVNKRIAWWISFTFILGMLACCIAGFVSINRFGFALEGAWCALDRIYYDSKFGQLKESDPKWEGFDNINKILEYLGVFVGKVKQYEFDELDKGNEKENEEEEEKENERENEKENYKERYINFIENAEDNRNIYILKYQKIFNSYKYLKKIIPNAGETNLVKAEIDGVNKNFNEDNRRNFETLKTSFLEDCYYYGRILKGWMKVLAMVYYCLFLIAVTFAGVSMMFYACLKKQGYLVTFMHVLWNIIRFFMFSFFIFGAAYGMFFLALRDSIPIVNQLFSPTFIKTEQNLLPKGGYLEKCLTEREFNFMNEIDGKIRILLEDFFVNYYELKELLKSSTSDYDKIEWLKDMNKSVSELCNQVNLDCGNLPNVAGKKGGLFGSFNCGFIDSYLHMVYRTLYDASIESRILSAVSLSAAFFGAVSVYFFLLVLHHYNNELFFDNGKSIFTGFDGFGIGYEKKNLQQNPAFKKRRLRAEIELTSKNDEANGFKDVNINEEEK